MLSSKWSPRPMNALSTCTWLALHKSTAQAAVCKPCKCSHTADPQQILQQITRGWLLILSSEPSTSFWNLPLAGLWLNEDLITSYDSNKLQSQTTVHEAGEKQGRFHTMPLGEDLAWAQRSPAEVTHLFLCSYNKLKSVHKSVKLRTNSK